MLEHTYVTEGTASRTPALRALPALILAGLMLAVPLALAQDGGSTGSTAPPAVSPDTISNGIMTGMGLFLSATLALVIPILLVGALSLQLARGYFLRTLDKFTLRLGADIWWLAYVMIRDALAFIALLMGLQFFYVGTFGDYPIAVPFMPLAIVLVAVVLVLRLVRDPDEEEGTNKVVTVLLAAATGFYLFGALFVTESISGYEAAGYVSKADGTLTTATGGSNLWTWSYNTFSSTVNTSLALDTFYFCLAALVLIGLYVLYFVLMPSTRAAPTRNGESGGDPKTAPRRSPPTTRDAIVKSESGESALGR